MKKPSFLSGKWRNNQMKDLAKQYYKKRKKQNIKITGLNIDKAEYQEIVTSNSNFPDKLNNSSRELDKKQ